MKITLVARSLPVLRLMSGHIQNTYKKSYKSDKITLFDHYFRLYEWLKKGLIKAWQVKTNSRLVWLVTADVDQLEQLSQQRSAQCIWIHQTLNENH
jgi:hypothetical protein